MRAQALPGGAAIVLHHEVTKLYLRLRRSEQRALDDPLTRLPNRLLLLDRLGQALQRAVHVGSDAALLTVDLDGFKMVNDSSGHVIGDGLLRLLGRRMAATLRRADTVAHWGGDEFVAVMPDPAARPFKPWPRQAITREPNDLQAPGKVSSSTGAKERLGSSDRIG